MESGARRPQAVVHQKFCRSWMALSCRLRSAPITGLILFSTLAKRTHPRAHTWGGREDCFCGVVITDKWPLCVCAVSHGSSHFLTRPPHWTPLDPRPRVCYYNQRRSCDRGGRLLHNLIETLLCAHCWETVGRLFGSGPVTLDPPVEHANLQMATANNDPG